MNLEGSSGYLPGSSRGGMQTIAAYEAILVVTDQMLQAAKNSDWDRLVALERDCRHLTTRLVEQSAEQKLSDEQYKKKISLIQAILARDAEIRAITEPWMMHLQNMLTNYDHKRKLGQTYQTNL